MVLATVLSGVGYAKDMPCGRPLEGGVDMMQVPAFTSTRTVPTFIDRPCNSTFDPGEQLTVRTLEAWGISVVDELVTGNEWIVEVFGATIVSGSMTYMGPQNISPKCGGRRSFNTIDTIVDTSHSTGDIAVWAGRAWGCVEATCGVTVYARCTLRHSGAAGPPLTPLPPPPPSLAPPALVAGDEHSLSTGPLTFRWEISGSSVNLELESSAIGWLSIGFSADASMTSGGYGAPALVGLVDPTGAPSSAFYLMQTYDVDGVVPHLIDGGDEAGGVEVVAVSREDGATRLAVRVPRTSAACAVLNAPAPFAACAGGPTYVLLAYGTSDNFASHPVGAAPAVVIDFDSGGVQVVKSVSLSLYLAHAALMALAWLVCAPAGTAIARYARSRSSWFVGHRALLGGALVLTVVGMALAFEIARGNHGASTHALVGYAVCGLAVLQGLLGALRPPMMYERAPPLLTRLLVCGGKRAAPTGDKAEVRLRRAWAWAHFILGHATLAVAAVASLLGAILLDQVTGLTHATYTMATVFTIGAWAVAVLALEIARRVLSHRVTGGAATKQHILDVVPVSSDELAKHATADNCWVVVRGRVYNVSAFARHHPGGKAILLEHAGRDATSHYEAVGHSARADALLATMLVADCVAGCATDATTTDLASAGAQASPSTVAPSDVSLLDAAHGRAASGFLTSRWRAPQAVTLASRVEVSPDTLRLGFALPPSAAEMPLGLAIGQHVHVRVPWCMIHAPAVLGEWNGAPDEEAPATPDAPPVLVRKYTPTSPADARGSLELLVKVYRGGVLERFVDGGRVSQYLAELSLGDELQISGPWGSIEYRGRGLFQAGRRSVRCARLGMLAGGTGLTPMLQVLRAILADEGDTTAIGLLYANQTEADILERSALDALAAAHPARFQVWYTIDRPPADWAFSAGFITAEMIAAHLPPPANDTLVLMCGPPPMVEHACRANLCKLGYAEEAQLSF